jgi:hypothetical protein
VNHKRLGYVSLLGTGILVLSACGGDAPLAPTPSVAATRVMSSEEGRRATAQEAEDKVTICHVPPGNPENAHTITIGAPAVDDHIQNHPGDHVGVCEDGGGG